MSSMLMAGFPDESAAAALSPSLPPKKTTTSRGQQEIMAAVAGVWERFKGTIKDRVAVLEQATLALLEGTLDNDLRQKAEREAHKLAGSLGIFGFSEGTRLAREMEHLFESGTLLGQAQTFRLSELVETLRQELERGPVAPQAPEPAPAQEVPLLLVIDHDPELAERLPVDAAGRGLRVEIAPNLSVAKNLLARTRPDAVVLDLASSDSAAECLALLVELNNRTPSVPAIVLAETDTLTARIETVRLSGRRFLCRPVSPAQILETVTQVLRQSQVQAMKVLAVAHDPQVLATLRTILQPQQLNLTTVDDPLRFWDTLEGSAPDLLILDIDLPHFSGIDLCKVVRSDPHWAGLPVLLLTAVSEADTAQEVFAAGADDSVSKSSLGPELLTRIVNRIERTRQLRDIAETDPLTGIMTRRRAEQMLSRFLGFAKRHQQPFALSLINLDHYHALKDQHGSAARDRVLRRLGQLLLRTFRAEDVVARCGEDQFLVGMYGTTRDNGVQRLAEVLETFRQEEFTRSDGSWFRASFSAGVAQSPADGAELPVLYRAVDEALAQAKAAGRDRVLPVGWHPDQKQDVQSTDVVLVEDDEALAYLLLHALETRGYRAQWLKDGEVAVEALGGVRPSLQTRVVLLDVGLPSLDGLSVLRRLAQAGVLQQLRVIMLTARSTEAEMVEALELGSVDYVTKPFSIPVLMRRIRRALQA